MKKLYFANCRECGFKVNFPKKQDATVFAINHNLGHRHETIGMIVRTAKQ